MFSEGLATDLTGSNLGDRGVTWIEIGQGLPPGTVEHAGELGLNEGDIIASWTDGASATELGADDVTRVVAFAEFLAGNAFEAGEREWLVDSLAREFEVHGEAAAEQLAALSAAVELIPALEPFERANRRYKALALMNRAARLGQTAGIPAPPILTIIDAHNPAIVNDDMGSIPTDALHYRQLLNRLVLDIGRIPEDSAPSSRLVADPGWLSPILRFELAGSQIRLVVMRTWLDTLEEVEFSTLQARLGEILETTTDLDMVVMQLSFRTMIDAIGQQLEAPPRGSGEPRTR